MWKLTLILNALLMGVFGFGSAVSQIKLRNMYVQYPHAGEGVPLPAISDLALKSQRAFVAIPIAWVIGTLILMILKWKRSEPPRDMVQLHTSATVLVGLFMLGFFVVAGIIPFLSFVVKMS
jgi:hypothetical protein